MAEHFVSPTGQTFGTGTIDDPWDWASTINGPNTPKVLPGDTLWIRGGTYRNAGDGWYLKLTGTFDHPIIVRNYNNERAIIDGRGGEYAFNVANSGYVWYWGLEVMDSNPTRSVQASGSDIHSNSYGVAVYSPGVRFINCIVHDTAQGFSSYNAAPDGEFYGNLSYYNGGISLDRNHGHGMYLQNALGTKIVEDNIIFDNADEGIQAYGSGAAEIIGISIKGNAIMNNSSWPFPHYQYNLVLGNGTHHNNEVLENWSFFPINQPDDNVKGYINMGQYLPGYDERCEDNTFIGQSGVSVEAEGSPFTFLRNRSVNLNGLRQITFGQAPGQNRSGYNWDHNQYFGKNLFYGIGVYDHDADFNFSEQGGINVAFADWKAMTGFDSNSSFAGGLPTSNWIAVRPNRYEQKRANIYIARWDGLPSTSVDLSSVLVPGDPYVIQDAQNFFGAPVASGTYTGGSVSIPLGNTAKTEPVGFTAPAHTAPLFNTFILLPVGAGVPITQPAPPPPSTEPPPPPPPPPVDPLTGLFTVGQTIVVKLSLGSNLNVRAFPDATLVPIGTEVPGTAGAITDGPVTAGGFTFYKVRFPDLFGWINQDFVQLSSGTVTPPPPPPPPPDPVPEPPPDPEPTPPPSPGAALWAIGDNVRVKLNLGANLNVRVAPDPAVSPAASEPPGTVGVVIAGPTTAGGFVFFDVRFSDVAGWVNQDFLEASPVAPPPPPPPPVGPPVPPSGLRVVVTIAWTPSTSATAVGTNVYRSVISGGPYTKISPQPALESFFFDSNVTGPNRYFYVATAVDANGLESAYSAEASALIEADPSTIPPPTVPLSPPRNLIITITRNT